MGCSLRVKDGIIIPFKREESFVLRPSEENVLKHKKYKNYNIELEYEAPFRDLIKELQHKRRQYPPPRKLAQACGGGRKLSGVVFDD